MEKKLKNNHCFELKQAKQPMCSFDCRGILQSCKNNTTIFATLHGGELIDDTDIMKQIDFNNCRQNVLESIDNTDISFNYTAEDKSLIDVRR